MDYLVEIHPENNKWIEFKENALKHFDENFHTLRFLHILRKEDYLRINLIKGRQYG